jgi:hypothetical protein
MPHASDLPPYVPGVAGDSLLLAGLEALNLHLGGFTE